MVLNPLLLSSFLLSFLLGWLWLRKATGSRLKFMARDGRDHFERAQARRRPTQRWGNAARGAGLERGVKPTWPSINAIKRRFVIAGF